jgi:hypothetical protein
MTPVAILSPSPPLPAKTVPPNLSTGGLSSGEARTRLLSFVAANVRLLEGLVLLDQSMLTSESVPIEVGRA